MSACKKILFLTITAFIAFIAIKINSLCQPPPVPKIENKWWGPGMPTKQDTQIKPFKINVSDKVLQDLQSRLQATRPFTPPLEGSQNQYGLNTNILKNLIDFWKKDYKWREREAFLNKFPQFTTKIQGLDIHFLHIKPSVPSNIRVLPLLLLHGWPGSVREFYSIIPLLTQPLQGKNFAFEIIAPSLPGFGFSQAASKPGLADIQMAMLFKNLMKRIGHEKFYVQGGDWGSHIATHMALLFPDNVLGLHSNMCIVSSFMGNLKLLLGSIYPPWFVEKEAERKMYPLMKRFLYYLEESGYFHIQATKPDTIGVALNESPVGLAAYILQIFMTATNDDYKFREDGGIFEKFTYTDFLDNIMLYWITGSATTAARIYAESIQKYSSRASIIPIDEKVPCACARFPNELFYFTDWILKEKFPNLIQTTDFLKGGHFAAMEEPELLAHDIFSAVGKMEKSRS